jgi:signal transduction histidine kinase
MDSYLSLPPQSQSRKELEKALIDLRATQARLLQAHKLEAIGQLAAGIAHEINTPTQYVTDNVEFLSRAFDRLKDLVAASRSLLQAVKANEITPEVITQAETAFASARVDYVMAETPKALAQSMEGLHRVAHIVSAMKDFSHPSGGEKNPVDLNESIATTITIATNEWKYVADVETNFDPDLPAVKCLRDEINQVVLNLIVNAAHAIDEATVGGSKGKGTIKVETRHDHDGWAEIRVTDTGCGIPENARNRVFDPFFTTKPVGKGTGQGLAIAYSVVVDKHRGEIGFDTAEGKGTTFVVRLPVDIHEERPSTFWAPLRQIS